MSLSLKAIERLFERLTLTYGREFAAQWDGLPIAEVKTLWSNELGHYAGRLEAIAWALENLPERAPNVVEFRNLCRRAPAPEAPMLPAPKADPQRLSAELAKLRGVIAAPHNPPARIDPRGWARRILARHEAGDKLPAVSVRFAREALGLEASPTTDEPNRAGLPA